MTEIDRSFAEQPPACLIDDSGLFQFPENKPWGVQGVEATRRLTELDRCMTDARGWIESEIKAREATKQEGQ